MRDQKTYVVGGDVGSANWIDGPTVRDIAKATLVVFTGGCDLNPRIYNKKRNPKTCGISDTRDAYELEQFHQALDLQLPMVGICRGAQLFCGMAGGSLVQHSDHPCKHDLLTSDGRKITVNSCHHQRAYPFVKGCEHYLLGWAPLGLSLINEGETEEDNMTGEPEAEVVFYKKINCLGIQSHPEWMWGSRHNNQETTDSLDYMRDLVDKLCDERL